MSAKEWAGFKGVKVGNEDSVARAGAGVWREIVVGSLNWGEELGRGGSFSSSEEFLQRDAVLFWEAERGRFSWLPLKLLLNCGGCLAGVIALEQLPAMPNAAISCGRSGRDLRRVF